MANKVPLVYDSTNGNRLQPIAPGEELQDVGGSVVGVVPGLDSVAVYRSTSFPGADGVWTTVSFDTVAHESPSPGRFFSLGQPTRLTIPVSGYYLLSGAMSISFPSTSNNCESRFLVNGSPIPEGRRTVQRGSASPFWIGVTPPISLAAGDYVEFQVRHSGQAVTFAAFSQSQTPFACWRVQ